MPLDASCAPGPSDAGLRWASLSPGPGPASLAMQLGRTRWCLRSRSGCRWVEPKPRVSSASAHCSVGPVVVCSAGQMNSAAGGIGSAQSIESRSKPRHWPASWWTKVACASASLPPFALSPSVALRPFSDRTSPGPGCTHIDQSSKEQPRPLASRPTFAGPLPRPPPTRPCHCELPPSSLARSLSPRQRIVPLQLHR